MAGGNDGDADFDDDARGTVADAATTRRRRAIVVVVPPPPPPPTTTKRVDRNNAGLVDAAYAPDGLGRRWNDDDDEMDREKNNAAAMTVIVVPIIGGMTCET